MQQGNQQQTTSKADLPRGPAATTTGPLIARERHATPPPRRSDAEPQVPSHALGSLLLRPLTWVRRILGR